MHPLIRPVFYSFLAISLTIPGVANAAYSQFSTPKEVRSTNLAPFKKWTQVLERFNEQKRQADAGCQGGGNCQATEWESLLTSLENKPVAEQMDAVNRFFNKVTYIEDSNNWGSKDYWATPYEMMARGSDCEDYAIAKYISLKRLGVSEDKMRILIVQDNNLGGIMHAVLQVEEGGKRYLLDNQIKRVVQQAKVFHYMPIYSINEGQWWAYKY